MVLYANRINNPTSCEIHDILFLLVKTKLLQESMVNSEYSQVIYIGMIYLKYKDCVLDQCPKCLQFTYICGSMLRNCSILKIRQLIFFSSLVCEHETGFLHKYW